MSNSKYLNGVLTVIAVCLVILTLSVIGVFPKANAASSKSHFVTVPVNADGSINVQVTTPTKVDITSVAGQLVQPDHSELTHGHGSLPIRK